MDKESSQLANTDHRQWNEANPKKIAFKKYRTSVKSDESVRRHKIRVSDFCFNTHKYTSTVCVIRLEYEPFSDCTGKMTLFPIQTTVKMWYKMFMLDSSHILPSNDENKRIDKKNTPENWCAMYSICNDDNCQYSCVDFC